MFRPVKLLIAITLAAATAVGAQDQASEIRTHQVVSGETLASIAIQYFGSASSWRAIFEANEDVLGDPQWIYPGQVLQIPQDSDHGKVQDLQVVTRPASRPAGPRPTPQEARVADRTVFYQGPYAPGNGSSGIYGPLFSSGTDRQVLLPAVPPDVFYAAGWLIGVDADLGSEGRVVGFAVGDAVRSYRTTAQPFDDLLVDLDDGVGVRSGDLLLTFRVTREIEHVGRVLVPTGMLTVLRPEGTGAVAEVSDEYGRLQIGDLVMRAPSYDMRAGVQARDTDKELWASIVTFQEQHELQSLGSIAFLDVGASDGVAVGDEFIALVEDQPGWSPGVIGRLQVVGVRAGASSARIISVRTPSFTNGMRLRLSRRMP